MPFPSAMVAIMAVPVRSTRDSVLAFQVEQIA
jgi:hypothetical protein